MSNIRNRRNGAFTLLEIMLVVVIIGMLAGIAVVKLGPARTQARLVTTKAQVEAYAKAVDMYEINTSTYPSTEQGLAALKTQPTTPPVPSGWKGPYIDIVKDPWNHDYIYRYPGQKNPSSYDVFSPGPDGVEGNEDDIGNWQQ